MAWCSACKVPGLPVPQYVIFVTVWIFFCLCRKPTVVTKYVGSDEEQILDETVNEDNSNENSENDVDMKSLPKGSSRPSLFLNSTNRKDYDAA